MRRLDAVKFDTTMEGIQKAQRDEEENARVAGLLAGLLEDEGRA